MKWSFAMQDAGRLTSRGQLLPVLVVLLVVGWCLAVGAGPAFASHVSCGDTITADTKLDSDLVDCPDNGIVIGADDITLDLNGHTIDGDGELREDCPEDQICDDGVVALDHARVTIQGGSLQEFALGVLVAGASKNRLLDLTVTRNMFPGVVIGESTETELSRSAVTQNGVDTDEAGLVVFHASESRITHNAISDNGDIGVFAEGADDSIFKRNELSGNREAAMLFEDSSRNTFTRNRVVGNGEGITVAGDENTISRNHVADSVAGVEGGGLGIFVAAGQNNLVDGNFVARASRIGIQVSLLPEELEGDPPAVDTIIRRNHLRDNRDGVFVQTTAVGTLLQDNHALGSDDDGIDVDSSDTTLVGNHAVHNGDLGIEAVFGVTDGGRNKARGNGNPAQCTNVSCK
jgi:parallel beta-helix repeat protein